MIESIFVRFNYLQQLLIGIFIQRSVTFGTIIKCKLVKSCEYHEIDSASILRRIDELLKDTVPNTR